MKLRLLVSFILLLAANSCGFVQQKSSSETTSLISPQSSSAVDILEAINASIAVESQIPRLLDSDGSPVAPILIDVILVFRADAYPDAPDIDDPERPMWIVRMVGEWADPLPIPEAEDHVYHSLEFIIDGISGKIDTWKASK